MEKAKQKEFDLYKDIEQRTNGEIYIGVVGPVRTGKSTFIKQFMELCVLPNIPDENQKTRAIDELPQSAQGKTIMTTEPKFIPQEAAEITMPDGEQVKVRLIDCVGFMVDGANGHMDENGDRMVKTPWMDEEIPFADAAKIGTQKVIRDHATIGIVVTTDGSITDIPRENYIAAERETIEEMQNIHKPFVIVLNCERPYSEDTKRLVTQMEQEYHTPVLAMNVKQMKKDDIETILEAVLREFPVTKIDFSIPKWTEMLGSDNRVKKYLIDRAILAMEHITKMNDLKTDAWKMALCGGESEENYIQSAHLSHISLSDGSAGITLTVADKYYYAYMSEMTGVPIAGDYQMISMIRDLSSRKAEYDKVKDAMIQVNSKGYGVVMPALSDITMAEPELIQHGSKFGVKVKATSPSIHMIKTDIETEIAPIVGSREQAEDLVAYIKEGSDSSDGVWNTNIFGKNLGEWMEDGIRSKITQMDDDCQMKLQDTMKKIVNDSNGGMICIII
jgi:stage IV sporulation protein A